MQENRGLNKTRQDCCVSLILALELIEFYSEVFVNFFTSDSIASANV